MLRVPGSDVDVELLQYHGCEQPVRELAALAPRHRPLLRLRHRDRRALRGAAGARRLVPLGRAGGDDGGRERGRQEPLLARPGRLHLRVPPAAARGERRRDRPADRPPLLEQYRLMALIRRFEDRAAELFQQGVIFGTAHSCVGQEAIAVGAAGVMRDTRLPRRPSPLARPPDRGRRRSAPDDGRDVREADGLLQGARRLDAHRRPLARHPRLQRDRRRRDPARVRRRPDREAARDGAGGGRVLRRRRRRSGRGARGDEPRRDLGAARRLHLREQPVRALGRLAGAARRRGSRRPRRRLRDGRRDRGRERPARRRGRGRARARAGPRRRRPDVPRDEDVPPDAALDAREPPGRARPGARRGVGGEGPAAAVRAAAARARGARRRTGRGRPARGRAATSSSRSRPRSPTRTRAPTTSCPRCSRRSGAIRRRPRRRSGRSASSPPCARRSTSSSRPIRT